MRGCWRCSCKHVIQGREGDGREGEHCWRRRRAQRPTGAEVGASAGGPGTLHTLIGRRVHALLTDWQRERTPPLPASLGSLRGPAPTLPSSQVARRPGCRSRAYTRAGAGAGEAAFNARLPSLLATRAPPTPRRPAGVPQLACALLRLPCREPRSASALHRRSLARRRRRVAFSSPLTPRSCMPAAGCLRARPCQA